MSRPFSYSDENFTVMGNVLFVHFKFEKSVNADEPLIEIPQKIYDRLLFYSNTASTCYSTLGWKGGIFKLTVNEHDGKHYFYSDASLSYAANRYIYSTFMLKDI